MHLDLVTIVVDEYEPAIRFFSRALGFDVVADDPSLTTDGRPKRWVVLRPPEGGTGLLLARADGPAQGERVGGQFAGRVGLFLRVDDFDGALARLRREGAELVREPRQEPYGRVAVFRDLAGNLWDLLST
ncbi:MAG: VOC family protein [Candidatus Dormibacteraceae bacterium]